MLIFGDWWGGGGGLTTAGEGKTVCPLPWKPRLYFSQEDWSRGCIVLQSNYPILNRILLLTEAFPTIPALLEVYTVESPNLQDTFRPFCPLSPLKTRVCASKLLSELRALFGMEWVHGTWHSVWILGSPIATYWQLLKAKEISDGRKKVSVDRQTRGEARKVNVWGRKIQNILERVRRSDPQLLGRRKEAFWLH